MHGAVHRQGQGEEVEGVKSGADVATRLTLDLGLELPVEQVHHDGAVPPKMVVPRLCEQNRQCNTVVRRSLRSINSPPVKPSGFTL